MATLGVTADETVRRGDAVTTAIVQRQWYPQAGRPFEQGLGLLWRGGVGAGQGPLHHFGPGGQPLSRGGLQAHTFLLNMLLPHPA